MAKPDYLHFFIDPNRCIGCQACVQACTECDTHQGESMIHLEYVDRSHSVQTVPVVCMHCEQPTCAEVCPADAIKRTGDGVVQSARKPRCIACGNCVVACPFGVPELYEDRKIMMKCDMCYDRTSVGKKPMCATVCPSQALFFGTREQIEQLRPLSTPVNQFQFGNQTITTQVYMMMPRALARPAAYVDVTAAMDDQPRSRAVSLKVVHADGTQWVGSRRERSVCRGGGLERSQALLISVVSGHVVDTSSRFKWIPGLRSTHGELAGPRGSHRHGAGQPLRCGSRARADHDSHRTVRLRTINPPGGRTSPSTGRRITTSSAATS